MSSKHLQNNHSHKLFARLLIFLLGFMVLLISTSLACGEATAEPAEEQGAQAVTPLAYDNTYYVSASGDDTTGDGTQANPWASLAKTAAVINSQGALGNYQVVVLTDLTSTACARYYSNNVTITSAGSTPCTVTRGTPFSPQSETRRGLYNPAMLEIGNAAPEHLGVTPATLTLQDIIFDDAYLHQGTLFTIAGTVGAINHVQDGIVASYDPACTIVLASGAQLHNFGGYSAVRVAESNLILKDGSLITDINANANTRAGTLAYAANGAAAISLLGNTAAHFTMESGAAITNIANAHGIRTDGRISFYLNGTISGLIGTRGMDTDPGAANPGRGIKNAISINSGPTLDPATGLPGAAIIGPDALIINNQIKSGAVQARGAGVSIKIYGKVNNNTALPGTQYLLGIPIQAGTHGGGLFLISGATVSLEQGSELCNNRVTNNAYGGGAVVQQGSHLINNGGLVQNNSSSAISPGIHVHRQSASFTMNGGLVDNGLNAVYLAQDDTQGNLTLNAGTVTGVTVQSTVAFGTPTTRHLYYGSNVTILSGYASVAGRQVTPLCTDFTIGNPNQAAYPYIRAALPQGWTMPTTNANVVAFYLHKTGTVQFSLPRPSTTAANYPANPNIIFAAIQPTLANGAADPAAPILFYPTIIQDNQVIVTVPLSSFPHGVTLALVQPANQGMVIFNAQPDLYYDKNQSTFPVDSSASYEMLPSLAAELSTNGFTPENTQVTLFITPDPRTTIDPASLTLVSSDTFSLAGASFNAVTGQLEVSLNLKPGWHTAPDPHTLFSFVCDLPAGNFVEDDYLHLTGYMTIVGGSQQQLTYRIIGTIADTLMLVPEDTGTTTPGVIPQITHPNTPDPKLASQAPHDPDTLPKAGDSKSLKLAITLATLLLVSLLSTTLSLTKTKGTGRFVTRT